MASEEIAQLLAFAQTSDHLVEAALNHPDLAGRVHRHHCVEIAALDALE